MGRFYRLFLVLFLLFGAELVTADLTELENKIIAIAERDKESAIALLARTVNINSGTMNHLGVKAVGEVFAEEFQHLGLTTTWHDMSEVNRAGHLFAETAGESGSRCLLLIGHLDTVFELDSPFQKFDRQGDHATGPGVNDMKGGDVVILYALKALKEVGVLDDLNLIGDEEKSGSPKSISRYHLIEASKRCDIALGFEIATSLNAATVARRGSSGWRLDVTGKRAHSAGIFNDEVGSGAIFEAARILNQFHEQLTGEEYLTFNPGVILGGTDVDYDPSQNKGGTFGKTNVVSQSVVVHGGLRTISPAQEASARARMKAIAENNHLPKTSAQITFQDGYPSMPPTEGNMAVLANLSGVSVDLDQGEVVAFDPGKRGAADVSFVAGYVNATAAIDEVQFKFSSGNIESGTIKMYGIT